jgi:hypothetical protein
MAHDIMCPYWQRQRTCQCELIRKVRVEEHNYIISIIEELPCKCKEGKDYCDGHTDAINAIEAIDPTDEVKDDRVHVVRK